MFIRPILLLFLLLLILIPSARSAPLDDWNALIVEGSKQKFDGSYDGASQSFTKAVAFAEKQKLPNKCLPISLCRLAESELNANKVKEADSHFDQITDIIKSQKSAGKLDSQVSFWGAALADAYLSNHKPETRELCLKHACYLKTLVYGPSHRNSIDCLNKLAEYYIETDKVDKGLKILEINEAILTKAEGKNDDRFGDRLYDLAIICENKKQYASAKQLVLTILKVAPNGKGCVNAGIPVFNSLLGVNALNQNKTEEGEQYFQKAISGCKKVKSHWQKGWVCKCLDQLTDSVDKAKTNKNLGTRELQYKHLLAMYEIVPLYPDMQYHVAMAIGDTICEQDPKAKNKKRMHEAMDYFKEAIRVNGRPASTWKGQQSSIYAKLAYCSTNLGELDEAKKYIDKAVSLETDTTGFGAANIYFLWGIFLERTNEHVLATEQLNKSYELTVKLSPEKRGTLLADLLQLLGYQARSHHNVPKSERLFQQSSKEIQLQKKLKTKLGPDIYHRM